MTIETTTPMRYAALSTLCLLLAACGSGGSIESTAVDPCAGVAGCVQVAVVDVDGDGSLDRVGVVNQAEDFINGGTPDPTTKSAGPITALVGIGQKVHRLTVESGGLTFREPAEIYRGAFAMTRTPGADLVLHTAIGQGGSDMFAVISWDGNALVTVAPPQPLIANAAGLWAMASSHGYRDSIRCTEPGEIVRVRLATSLQDGNRNLDKNGGKREEDKYTFAGGAWQPAGSENFADNSLSYTDGWSSHANAFGECKNLGRKQ
ncbi:hypothetical protein [Tsukamurella sp. NPDC003166]|uniref:hypothetical protein n=1 Tax=Tsukamurella sp. NPDC003166 TaxID=3154444 RepID=UPI0033BC8C02